MKKRKFDEGGSVYERAKRFLRDQGVTDETPALDEKIASSRGNTRRSIPASGDALPMVRETSVEPEERSRSATPTPAPTPTPRASTPAGKFTDSDAESRAARRSEADEENVKRIQRARDEEENTSRIRQARYQAPEPDRGAALRDIERKDAATRAAQSAAADARNVAEIEDARGKLMSNTNRMGVRAAQQMEDKGSIYSPDFGKPRAVREAESKTRRMPLPRSQRMFQGRRQMDRPTSPGGYAKGGSVSSASNRADGIAKRGKTRGRVL